MLIIINMRLEICRMLGYNYGLPTIQSRFGAVPATFAMDDVACIGNEASLLDCPHNSQDNCGANEGAGVICENCGKVVMKLWVFCSPMVFGKRVLLSKSIFFFSLKTVHPLPLDAVDASWGSWGSWRSCSRSCGGGVSHPN